MQYTTPDSNCYWTKQQHCFRHSTPKPDKLCENSHAVAQKSKLSNIPTPLTDHVELSKKKHGQPWLLH
jgi:hypothetical protein